MSFVPLAGLNYGVFRRQSFNTTPQYIMLYDMGAGSTVATIIGKQQLTLDITILSSSPHLTPTFSVLHAKTKGQGAQRLE